MRGLALASTLLLMALAASPTAAAQGPLPPNPFDDVACAWGLGNGGLLGYLGAMWLLTCGYVLDAGSVTYDYACGTVQGGC